MSGEIFLIRDNELIELREHPYLTEEDLQLLLARHPRLLAGEQMNGENPRRWLLVSRETPLPDAPDAGGRWSVDHLFLDQDGIPTLVEVKRSSDTRIRREVVGQMLDYAANAVLHLSIETLQSEFERTSSARGEESDQALLAHLGEDTDPAAFWDRVQTNLQVGRIRLLFVADVIPPELRRVVEFLNGQMSPAEVLAVELRQYVGEGLRTLVPSVIGQTNASEQRKGRSRDTRQWDEPSFMAAMGERVGEEGVRIARRILEWAKTHQLRIGWGKGKNDGSFFPMFDYRGEKYGTISVWTYGRIEMQFESLKTKPPFESEELRLEFLHRLNQIPNLPPLPKESITRRPGYAITALSEDKTLNEFLSTLDWIIEEIKRSK